MGKSDNSPVHDATIRRYKRNLREEVDGVALYQMLGRSTKDPSLQKLFQNLEETESKHVDLWVKKLREAGQEIPNYGPSVRSRVIGFIAARFGVASVATMVSKFESNAFTMYDDQPEAVAEGLEQDERSHARLFQVLASAEKPNVSNIASLEGRHRSFSGNAIRAAVLGANDGLVSNLSLVMGVAGASSNNAVVAVAGLAGLLAGAISMALGEWISVRSSSEAYERQIAIEADELLEFPEEERQELVMIYQSKGLSEEEALVAADRILENPDLALDTLVREELNVNASDLGSPFVAAISSFVLFAVGAVLPVIPWLITSGSIALVTSIILGGCGLFILGSSVTLWTGLNPVFSGLRMLFFGLVASGITYGIGSVIGIWLDIG